MRHYINGSARLRRRSFDAGRFCGISLAAICLLLPQANLAAQEQGKADPEKVVVDRMPLILRSSEKYEVELQLQPAREVVLTAPVDGWVESVHVVPSQKVGDQEEVIQLKNTVEELRLERAKAQLQVAKIEVANAAKASDPAGAKRLAEAKETVAEIDVRLAQHQYDQSLIRVPFAGEVLGIKVVPGQYVRVGEPLLNVAETKRLQVMLPVDRKTVKEQSLMEIRVEDQTTQAKVLHVLPPPKEFLPMRDLTVSLGAAVLEIDNARGGFFPYQRVYAPLIPRDPITEIPTASITNAADAGKRKVQVIRKSVVHDVMINLHAQVGEDRVYVSGPFANGDELILKASTELADGTFLRAATASSGPSNQASNQPSNKSTSTPAAPNRSVGF